MPYTKLTELTLTNQRVLIREDFNVPMQAGVIADDTRLRAAIPTIEYVLKQNAAVILMSHWGRPKEGEFDSALSLAPVAHRLSELLTHTHTHTSVRFISDWINGITISPGEIVLCENVRFLVGEKKCDAELSQKMAALCDVFVMDAFATAHRAEASTAGVAKFAKKACAGLLLDAELTALSRALTHPQHPVVAIVGGSKVSTKMEVLENLLDKVSTLIVGGGIANTFLAAMGVTVGNSLIESDWIEKAQQLLKKAASKNVSIPLPVDVIVAKQFSVDADAIVKSIHDIAADDMILDVGPKTAEKYAALMHDAKTIVWNGPVGVFEFPAFAKGTRALADAIASSDAFSIAGGGDTLSAIAQFGCASKISYLSTGGGAFLELMEGKSLPGVQALKTNS